MKDSDIKKPAEVSGIQRWILKVKIWLYNKKVKSKLVYENEDGGTTHRIRTDSHAEDIKSRMG